MDFGNIFENLHDLSVPSTLWGVHLDAAEHVAGILRMNVSKSPALIDRAVLICQDKNEGVINTSTVIDGNEVVLQDVNYAINELSDVQELIETLESLKECVNAGCEEYVVVREACNAVICDSCTKRLDDEAREDEETAEIKIEVTKAQIFCTECSTMFVEQETFDNHKEECKKNTANRHTESCPICMKRFSKVYIKEHMLTHFEKRALKCRFCPKTFTKSSNRSIHENTHTGKKPYVCDQCPLNFASRNGLRYHQDCHHSNEKKFICNFCGKQFARNDYLKEHMKIHSDEKKYKCEICDKGFKHASHLTIHRRRHTGERPYKCQLCSKGFSSSTNLKLHTQTHNKYKFVGIIDET